MSHPSSFVPSPYPTDSDAPGVEYLCSEMAETGNWLGGTHLIEPQLVYSKAPERWKDACTHKETTLNQLSPYIGKLKSSIARDVIESYSRVGDLLVDPFSGSGTIPFEAACMGRRVFSADISSYAKVLCKAKLSAPSSLELALEQVEVILKKSSRLPDPDLDTVPEWVREFFHPDTLVETLKFASLCRSPGKEFFMACLLGILHHQRPGFLSYPSSHLTPYLRSKKYPRENFPEMYEYRELRQRIVAKIQRAYKRHITLPVQSANNWVFRQSAITNLAFPAKFDCLITSPPYMNALDYERDNRLRLWFLNPVSQKSVDDNATRAKRAFDEAIIHLAKQVEKRLSPNGHCVLIVGEILERSFKAHPANTVQDIISKYAPSLQHITTITDDIPDIRRARRELKGIKTEQFLVFKKQNER